MIERLQAIRGMNDILPSNTLAWRQLEQIFAHCMFQYGYEEIRFPLVESTALFKRSIGEVTDIVEKEMYTFIDLNGDSLTLRPEGTAGCLRACLEHGLLHNQQQKLWYLGSMFRHEKPQKGRYRQFNQFGIEAIGIEGIAIELEMISICQRLWKTLGIAPQLELQINSLGTLHERIFYRNELTNYLKKHIDKLDPDSKRRLDRNPLRVLDSKHPEIQDIIKAAPVLLDFLSAENRQRFEDLCRSLTDLDINYTINPFLVRGLDYYGHLVFEWVTTRLGSQATVCAGGRYDALVEQLGGPPTPAIGCAMGLERLILLLETLAISLEKKPFLFLFIIATEPPAIQQALSLAEQLRNANSQWRVVMNTVGGSFKSQFKKADKNGADIALVIGEDEAKSRAVSIKYLRKQEEQKTILQEELIRYLLACSGKEIVCQYT